MSRESQKNCFSKIKKQRGYGLIELSIAAGLAAIVVLLAWAYVPGILASYNASKVTNELQSAIPKIQASYNNRTSYAGLTTAEVAKRRWFSDGMTEMTGNVPTGKILTKWGEITFGPASGNNLAVGTINNVPSRECNNITDALSSNLYVSATVNSTSIKTATTALASETAADQCNSSEANTITFNFRR